jgi:hypothetical protein
MTLLFYSMLTFLKITNTVLYVVLVIVTQNVSSWIIITYRGKFIYFYDLTDTNTIIKDLLFNENFILLVLFLLTVIIFYIVWVILRTLWYYIKVYYKNNNSKFVHSKKFKILFATIFWLILFGAAM